MPETIQSPDLDEFELHELALLAPSRPRIPDDDWEVTRAEILHSLTATPLRRGSRLPRLAVAAAAVAVVGVLGHGALTSPHSGLSPATVGSQKTQAAPLQASRIIPAGQYATRTSTLTETLVVAGRPRTTTQQRTVWLDSRSMQFQRVVDAQGRGDIPPSSEPLRNLDGLPRDALAMRAWFLERDRGGADSRPDDEVVWVAATDLTRHLGSSAAVRRELVAMLRTNPRTTITHQAVQGRRAVVVTHTRQYDDGQQEESTITLDASSMALLQESTKLLDKDGKLQRSELRQITIPEHLVDHRP